MLISIIIPVYNAEKYVGQAVESALSQPETGEVILIEDGSPDNSLQACHELAEKYSKIKLLRHADSRNRGAAASRNLGIKNASFNYIAFLDADDYYLPGCFELAVNILNSNQDIDGVYEAVGTYFEDEKLRDIWFWRNKDRQEMTTVKKVIDPDDLFESLITEKIGYFHTNGILIRKKVFSEIGYFDEHLKLSQDSCMWFKMAAKCQLVPGNLTQPLRIRRVHSSNRISMSKEQFYFYAIKKWQCLFNWAKEFKLKKQHVDILFNKYFYTCLRYLKVSILYERNILNMFKIIKIILLENPSIVTSPFLWFLHSKRLILSKLK